MLASHSLIFNTLFSYCFTLLISCFSVLLVISVVGAFSPTLFYLIYGNHSWSCESCVSLDGQLSCGGCQEVAVCTYYLSLSGSLLILISYQIDLDEDPVYIAKARYVSSSFILFFLYTIVSQKIKYQPLTAKTDHLCIYVLLYCQLHML